MNSIGCLPIEKCHKEGTYRLRELFGTPSIFVGSLSKLDKMTKIPFTLMIEMKFKNIFDLIVIKDIETKIKNMIRLLVHNNDWNQI